MTTRHEQPLLPEEERNATVAVYGDLSLAEDAVRSLEREGLEKSHLPIIAKGMNTERHVTGFDTHIERESRWAGYRACCSGRFFLIPGVGHVAIGGYSIMTGGVGVGAGALTAALSTVGVPDDAVIRYSTAIKADKQVLIAHGGRIDVERAREVLAGTGAESVEVLVGDGEMVA